MNHRRALKKVALVAPGLKGILREKDDLYRLTQKQKDQIDSLIQQKQNLEQELVRRTPSKKDIFSPLLKDEVLKADANKSRANDVKRHSPPFKLNWVVPAAKIGSGGQADIFRTIKFLSDKGHECNIYIYDPGQRSSLKEQKELIKYNHPELKTKIFYNSGLIEDGDAIFATHWVTAYPVYNSSGRGKKHYYVQDFEPLNEEAYFMRILAEETYNFGFHGFVLGEWLAEKLNSEYKMTCDYFDFGYNPREYFLTGAERTKDILYYAQPGKSRRGFELGMIALELFHAKNPTSKIHLFGSDLSAYKIPFKYVDHGVMTVSQLNDLYNHCAAGLALSFTNMSLIPLEMIAAGCQPLVNDAYHTKKVKYKDRVMYANPSPQAMADALHEAVAGRSIKPAKLPSSYTWDSSNQTIESALLNSIGLDK